MVAFVGSLPLFRGGCYLRFVCKWDTANKKFLVCVGNSTVNAGITIRVIHNQLRLTCSKYAEKNCCRFEMNYH
jgi:hypothetical protein